MSKAPVAFPPGTFRASAKVVHEKKADSDDDEPTKYSHELFTEYTFHEDGTYVMHGYPPINEKGRVVVNEKVRFSVHARRLAALTTSRSAKSSTFRLRTASRLRRRVSGSPLTSTQSSALRAT